MRISDPYSTRFISLHSLILIHLLLINMVSQKGRLVSGGLADYCYSDIGCFPITDEFYHPRHRPFNVRPWHRSRVSTTFDLYNRKHPDGYRLKPWNGLNLLHSGFDPMLETKIIIPGWLDNIKRAVWVRRMKDAFLWLWQPVNIIVVHWVNFTPYTIATANTRVVGAELANMLKFLEQELNYNRAYHHLIGHSLGAHISGYAGDRLPGLGRITALDPARPFFQNMPKSVRLDRADARFVDAIHSDFTPENAIFLLMSFGMTTPVGHLDFYPNGPPLLQTGCLRDTILSAQRGIQRGLEHSSLSVAFLETIRYLTACDHQRSHEWFIESITNRGCLFVGVRCNTFEGLINGRCTCDDSRSACAIMGVHADQMYLNQAHEDLWPLGSRRKRRRPELVNRRPQQQQQQLIAPTSPVASKGEMYLRLKQQAEQLRKPQVPQMTEELLEDFSNMEDSAFTDYLRTNLMLQPDSDAAPVSESGVALGQDDDDESLRRRQDVIDYFALGHLAPDADFGSGFGFGGQQAFNGHPKLLSDVDRDIESWYEESSRWHLKTSRRPNYCVHQYQVMVFLGPLKTSTGLKRLRANLIISIIGSRGQLLNQRFVPRSANLDSYTMQPFFIILDGTYSLGNIVSVAVGWEARLDPDPVQATISFQSNLLESVQPAIPAYKPRNFPWISSTLKHDYSKGFEFQRRNVYRLPKMRPPTAARISKRSALLPELADCSAPKADAEHCKASSGLPAILQSTSDSGAFNILDPELLLASSSRHSGQSKKSQQLIDFSLNDYLATDGGRANPLEDYDEEDEDEDEEDGEDGPDTVEQASMAEVVGGLQRPDLHSSGSDYGQLVQHMNPAHYEIQTKPSSHLAYLTSHSTGPNEQHLLEDIFAHEQGQIKAELHNIGIHQDRAPEDSIVVSQVVVSPLHATYGKSPNRSAKVFCPPHPNYRLEKERTVRMVPNLLAKCQNHHLSRPMPVH